MMAIATSDTIHTPPTKEPAIRESCCPSSDLYSSAEHTHTQIKKNIIFHTPHMFQSCIHTAEHFWKGKYITDSFFLSLIHRKYHLQGSFYMTASTLHKHTHTHTETKGEFNHFTARISLLRNPLTFPLSALHSLSSPPRKPTPTQTPPHTPDNHPPTYRR